MNETPSEKKALLLLREAGCSQKVIKHCVKVSKLAYELATRAQKKGYSIDLNLVKVGGLLHDLGRSKTHKVEHGIKGGEIARRLKLPSGLVRIIERHVGAGITEKEAKKIGVPKGDYIPETVEEKIVCYADKLIKGSGRMSFNEALKEMVDDLGPDHPAIIRFIKLHQSISDLTS